MRLCLPARMGGGGKAESTPWRGPAGAQRPPLGGGYSALGTRGQSPWCSPPNRKTEPAGSLTHKQRNRQVPPPAARHKNGALARRDADGRPAASSKSLTVVARSAAPAKGHSADRPRASGKERRKSASGSAQKRRALRSAAGQSAFLENPAHYQQAERTALATAIVTDRQRRRRWLGGASRAARHAQ